MYWGSESYPVPLAVTLTRFSVLLIPNTQARRERAGVPNLPTTSERRDLAGFRYREIVRKLRACGFQFDRQAAGSHEQQRFVSFFPRFRPQAEMV